MSRNSLIDDLLISLAFSSIIITIIPFIFHVAHISYLKDYVFSLDHSVHYLLGQIYVIRLWKPDWSPERTADYLT